ncbi:MAG: prephenate dehydrogenase [Ignavibacteriae bacterium]|nr:MAG: prephenate dehydrogenase [Ignavibacteriota bacterium]
MNNHPSLPFSRITIIGVGLIGGSLALAIKHRFPTVQITGVDKPRILERAKKRKAIDHAEHSAGRAVRSAGLVILAAPVSVITSLLPIIAKNAPSHVIVTDTGSVKHGLVTQAQKLFPRGNFIGGHPMAGSEFSGIDAAHPLLFQNAIYILTPTRSTNRKSINTLAAFFTSLDARIFVLDPAVHDSIVAAVSHLPQLAAVALMNTVGNRHPHASTHLALAAGGFRDMTRIASSKFEMWKDILSANRKEIDKALRLYINQLERMAAAVHSRPSRLSTEFHTSRRLRMRIPPSMKGFLSPLVDLSVFVEDKPGELARLTSSLSKKNINIKDMELIKVREGRGGTFRLSFENRTVSNDAARTLQRVGFDVSRKS